MKLINPSALDGKSDQMSATALEKKIYLLLTLLKRQITMTAQSRLLSNVFLVIQPNTRLDGKHQKPSS